MADASFLDVVLDADDRREAAIDGNDADFAFFACVFVGGVVTATVFHGHLDHQWHIVRHRRDVVLGIENLNRFVVLEVRTVDDALLVAVDADRFRLVRQVFHDERLDVQNDVGDIFHHAGDRRDFVLDALDFHAGHRRTFEARQENAS